MQGNKITIKAPAKINLFLQLLNKRIDGYHNINSGITFIDLYDEIEIQKSNSFKINYTGPFKPSKGIYKDCIIKKIVEILPFDKKINLDISINKNIPVQGGLGSASTNAVGFIKGLQKLKIIKLNQPFPYTYYFGADIESFLFGKSCIVKGIGDKVIPFKFPKYFFLLVKPKVNFSTRIMYSKLKIPIKSNIKMKKKYLKNDFEKIAKNKSKEIIDILHYLRSLDNIIFANLTGSGSCCYAVFKKRNLAEQAQYKFNTNFPNLWTYVGENL